MYKKVIHYLVKMLLSDYNSLLFFFFFTTIELLYYSTQNLFICYYSIITVLEYGLSIIISIMANNSLIIIFNSSD